jgi:hypothetical protein
MEEVVVVVVNLTIFPRFNTREEASEAGRRSAAV